ncbi:uracil-DNA glycosylase [Thalassotalea sp. G2M2-11]|uniref:uracil-DNA glycosylase n=1 Tax=Thalassotalea sp. G2M2-11 TaxID=2787627 RepID=UPI0019D08FDC|nr:uracil-DNA glycosylase [Thalassotalea sp. G2M2-11]
MNDIKPQWQSLISLQQQQEYFQQLINSVDAQRSNGVTIFPNEHDVFNAFRFSDLSEIKVVILGQDPYHGVGSQGQPQAHGLAFSVNHGVKVPPSLVNIYKELTTDIDGFITPSHGNLTEWAEQGVLLLNTVLTVQQGKAHSHAKLGWETFTDAVINELSEKNSGCVFILWGSHAQKKGRAIDTQKHCVLNGPHPSPLSAYRGFFGSKPFSQANDWLLQQQKIPINWQITQPPLTEQGQLL